MSRTSGWGNGSEHTSHNAVYALLILCRFHLGRGREVPSHPLFHESVKIRMENPLLNYSPRAQYKKGTEKYVS